MNLELKDLPAGLTPKSLVAHSPTRRQSAIRITEMSRQATSDVNEMILDTQTNEQHGTIQGGGSVFGGNKFGEAFFLSFPDALVNRSSSSSCLAYFSAEVPRAQPKPCPHAQQKYRLPAQSPHHSAFGPFFRAFFRTSLCCSVCSPSRTQGPYRSAAKSGQNGHRSRWFLPSSGTTRLANLPGTWCFSLARVLLVLVVRSRHVSWPW